VEVGTKLVAPLERSPVPGEQQLDRQRQEPRAHPREGVKRGAVAGVRAGTGEQRIGGVETHRLKPGSHSSDAVPVRQVSAGDPLDEGHISGKCLRRERLKQELVPDGMDR
jgi:hypothetical protein